MTVTSIHREEVFKAYTQLQQRIDRFEKGQWVAEEKTDAGLSLSELLTRIKKLEERVTVLEKKGAKFEAPTNPYEWMKHFMLPFGSPIPVAPSLPPMIHQNTYTHVAPSDWSPPYNSTHTVLINGVPQPSATTSDYERAAAYLKEVAMRNGDSIEIISPPSDY